tara:strand:+ start:21589 stop:23301 length:1713 start_codon:yes stop_codon:yes gene_type:complete
MKKKLLSILVFIFFFTSIYLVNKKYILNTYETETLNLKISYKSLDNDLFQLFYRDSIASPGFEERLSERINIKSSDNYQELVFNIPDSLKVTHFRFDIGNNRNTSPVNLKQMIFQFNGNELIIEGDEIHQYFRPNSFIEKLGQNYHRKVNNDKSDPIFTSVNLYDTIQDLKEKPNYTRVLLNFLLAAILSLGFTFYLVSSKLDLSFDRFNDWSILIGFMFILLAPHLDNWINLDKTNISEKRDLIEKPKFNFRQLNDYPQNYEEYYNDNFGFRKKLISFGALTKVKLFSTSPDLEKVIVGENKWLFYWNKAIKSSYLKENPFNCTSLDNFGNNLKKIDKLLREQNKTFIVTIYPNKHTIYEEKIPTRFKHLKNEGENRLEQLYSYLKSNNIQYVNHIEMLLSKKKLDVLYLKNDSHWNSLGAFYAYQNIIDEISKSREQVKKPLGIEDFKVERIENYNKGDLLDLLGIDNSGLWLKDTYIKLTPLKEVKLEMILNKFGSGSISVENSDSDNNDVALFFGDSYSVELMKLLPLSFKKTILVRDLNLNERLIEQINPNIIVYGMVERNLENF